MLQGYIDESELSELGIFAVAAYVWDGVKAAWFHNEWQAALADMGLSESRFHMSEFDNRRGHFSHWPEDQRIPRLQRLHAIINASITFGAYATIDLRAFQMLPAEQLGVVNPYNAAVFATLGGMARAVVDARVGDETIVYVLDRVNTGSGVVKDAFDAYAQRPGFWQQLMLGSVEWASSYDVLQLQAADILAYEMAKFQATQLGRWGRPIRQSLTSLVEAKPDLYGGMHFGPEELETVFSADWLQRVQQLRMDNP